MVCRQAPCTEFRASVEARTDDAKNLGAIYGVFSEVHTQTFRAEVISIEILTSCIKLTDLGNQVRTAFCTDNDIP
jgi:hypothetical protein